MKKLLTAGVVSVLALSVYGCATIVRGTSQEIPVTVMPYGARIFVTDEARGSTPATLTLKRTGSYQIKIKKDGYETLIFNIDKEFKMGWAIIGNAFSWSVIGIAVDIVNGGAYELIPEQIVGELKQAGISVIEDIDIDSYQLVIFLKEDLE